MKQDKISRTQLLALLWAGVLVVVLLTYIPAEKLTAAIVSKDDSFLASVTINILCTVFLMSILPDSIAQISGC